jgi:hypothetical protein
MKRIYESNKDPSERMKKEILFIYLCCYVVLLNKKTSLSCKMVWNKIEIRKIEKITNYRKKWEKEEKESREWFKCIGYWLIYRKTI